MVDGVLRPNDRVYELIQARKRCPHHVVACCRVPSFQVPRKRNEGKEKPEEGEDGEQRICRIDHCDLSWGDEVCEEERRGKELEDVA